MSTSSGAVGPSRVAAVVTAALLAGLTAAGAALRTALEDAARGPTAPRVQLDAGTRQRLRALGYLVEAE